MRFKSWQYGCGGINYNKINILSGYGYIFEPMASIMAVSGTMMFQVYGSTAASDSMRSESEVFFSRLVIIETSVLVEELLSLGLLVR